MCRLAQITLYPIALEGGDRYIGLPCFHPQYVPKRLAHFHNRKRQGRVPLTGRIPWHLLHLIARALENRQAGVLGKPRVRRRALTEVKDRTPVGAHGTHVPARQAQADAVIFRSWRNHTNCLMHAWGPAGYKLIAIAVRPLRSKPAQRAWSFSPWRASHG